MGIGALAVETTFFDVFRLDWGLLALEVAPEAVFVTAAAATALAPVPFMNFRRVISLILHKFSICSRATRTGSLIRSPQPGAHLLRTDFPDKQAKTSDA
jgi:hypothetical protein